MIKIIGIMTENFRLYYDLVRALKESGIPFVSLSFRDRIPENVGVIITSREEAQRVRFPRKVWTDIGVTFAIHLAKKMLSGKETFQELLIGIDPGDEPGVAVVGDTMLLQTVQACSPEDVLRIVEIAILMYPANVTKVRIGHGSPTQRNRIINALIPLKLGIEIVDERRTTKRSERPDLDATLEIAFMEGREAKETYAVKPSNGELRNIQRLSRLRSVGKLTISRALAEKVAKGRLSLEEAIKEQTEKGGAGNH